MLSAAERKQLPWRSADINCLQRMYPFRRILIPTDFSTASEWAFDDAVRIAETTRAEIVILHIRMTWEKNPVELRFPADPSLYEYAEQHELNLLRQRTKVPINTRLVVKQGPDPGVEIARTAAEEDADLIVIATHARGQNPLDFFQHLVRPIERSRRGKLDV